MRQAEKPGQQEGVRLSAPVATWMLIAIIGIPLALLTAKNFGADTGIRFGLYLVVIGLLATFLLRALRRRIGSEPNRLATVLTLSRLVTGCALAAFILAGVRDRLQPATIMLWVLVVLTATLSDWFDGPLSRREGATRFQRVLDIESDSWLTLWSAFAAILLGDMPWVCLLAPVVRYIHPVRALLAGGLPAGGGPWWSRVTGMTQMGVLMAAFAPVTGAVRDEVFSFVIWPVSLAQLATMLALLALPRR